MRKKFEIKLQIMSNMDLKAKLLGKKHTHKKDCGHLIVK